MSKKIDSSYDAKVLLREYKFLEKEDFAYLILVFC